MWVSVHACSLTRKQCVGAGQAGLVGGIPPAQPPQAAAALFHWHQGGVVNTRKLLATPRGETLATCTDTWAGKGRSTKNKSIRRRRKKEETFIFKVEKRRLSSSSLTQCIKSSLYLFDLGKLSPSEQRGPPQPSQHALTVLFTVWLSISGGLRRADTAGKNVKDKQTNMYIHKTVCISSTTI